MSMFSNESVPNDCTIVERSISLSLSKEIIFFPLKVDFPITLSRSFKIEIVKVQFSASIHSFRELLY